MSNKNIVLSVLAIGFLAAILMAAEWKSQVNELTEIAAQNAMQRDRCESQLTEALSYEPLFEVCNENLDQFVELSNRCWTEIDDWQDFANRCWMDSSDACYTAQDEVLVFLDQAIKNMDSFYCSEVLRTDEIACNIMDARFVIVENLELMCEGYYPE